MASFPRSQLAGGFSFLPVFSILSFPADLFKYLMSGCDEGVFCVPGVGGARLEHLSANAFRASRGAAPSVRVRQECFTPLAAHSVSGVTQGG